MQQTADEGCGEGGGLAPQVKTLEITTPLDKIAEAEIAEAQEKENADEGLGQELGESKIGSDNGKMSEKENTQ